MGGGGSDVTNLAFGGGSDVPNFACGGSVVASSACGGLQRC